MSFLVELCLIYTNEHLYKLFIASIYINITQQWFLQPNINRTLYKLVRNLFSNRSHELNYLFLNWIQLTLEVFFKGLEIRIIYISFYSHFLTNLWIVFNLVCKYSVPCEIKIVKIKHRNMVPAMNAWHENLWQLFIDHLFNFSKLIMREVFQSCTASQESENTTFLISLLIFEFINPCLFFFCYTFLFIRLLLKIFI